MVLGEQVADHRDEEHHAVVDEVGEGSDAEEASGSGPGGVGASLPPSWRSAGSAVFREARRGRVALSGMWLSAPG